MAIPNSSQPSGMADPNSGNTQPLAGSSDPNAMGSEPPPVGGDGSQPVSPPADMTASPSASPVMPADNGMSPAANDPLDITSGPVPAGSTGSNVPPANSATDTSPLSVSEGPVTATVDDSTDSAQMQDAAMAAPTPAPAASLEDLGVVETPGPSLGSEPMVQADENVAMPATGNNMTSNDAMSGGAATVPPVSVMTDPVSTDTPAVASENTTMAANTPVMAPDNSAMATDTQAMAQDSSAMTVDTPAMAQDNSAMAVDTPVMTTDTPVMPADSSQVGGGEAMMPQADTMSQNQNQAAPAAMPVNPVMPAADAMNTAPTEDIMTPPAEQAMPDPGVNMAAGMSQSNMTQPTAGGTPPQGGVLPAIQDEIVPDPSVEQTGGGGRRTGLILLIALVLIVGIILFLFGVMLASGGSLPF